MDYPAEWGQLPRHERRKKFRQLNQQQEKKTTSLKKVRSLGLGAVAIFILVVGVKLVAKKSPQQIEFEQKLEVVSLEGKVEEFSIEGRDHVSLGTNVDYQTNPPTSGGHLAQAKNWGVYSEEIDDQAVIHGLEHGGIWISYKDIDETAKKILEEIGRANSQSVIVSPRSANDNNIVVASWGRSMKLELVDKVLIQKYINTYKNQSPEKLAL